MSAHRVTVVRRGYVLDVTAGQLLSAAVWIAGQRIVEVDLKDKEPPPGARVIDAAGRVAVPGYIEPHGHVGFLADPAAALAQMLRHGTTTVVTDLYPLVAQLSDGELETVFSRLEQLPVRVRFIVAPHARGLLEDELRRFGPERIVRLMQRPTVAAAGEFTRWPDVEMGDPELVSIIEQARALGKRVEGHAPGASFQRLQRLAERGFTSCHEAIRGEEVLWRLRAGLHVILRHGSLRPDMPALVRELPPEALWSPRLMLTSDGSNPVWMNRQGHLDVCLAAALQSGVPAAAAYRMASLNAAAYFRMDDETGLLAPGKAADLVLLDSLEAPRPSTVIVNGQVAVDDGELAVPFPPSALLGLAGLRQRPGVPPQEGVLGALFDGAGRPRADLPHVRLAHSVITRLDERAAGEDVAVLWDWDGRWMSAMGLSGWDVNVGGVASSYNSAFELILIGRSAADMALAARRVMETGGGIAVADGGRLLWELALPLGGWVSAEPFGETVRRLEEFDRLVRERGYRHADPTYTLLFFTFDSLPDVRLSHRGVWDVKGRRLLRPSLRL